MSLIEERKPGVFCWSELGTTDVAAAKSFYTGLFGWTAEEVPMGPDSVYTTLKLEDRELGGAYELNEQQRQRQIPPHWLLYVAVDSADASAAKAKELGATVLMEPFDVMEGGRMAVIQDPQGAVFAVWQAKKHIGARIAGQPGALCWSELATTDAVKAREFYSALFGWGLKVSQMGPVEYTEWQQDGGSVGGMMQMTAEWGNIPPHWMAYFQVTDCDSAAAKAKELGAEWKVPPTDIPPVGRFSVIQDPQGAVFSIIQLAPGQ